MNYNFTNIFKKLNKGIPQPLPDLDTSLLISKIEFLLNNIDDYFIAVYVKISLFDWSMKS